MWFSWTLLGLIQIVSARYMGKNYQWRLKIHQVTGWLGVIFSMLSGGAIFIYAGYKINVNYHSITGLFTLAQIPVIAAIGIIGSMARYGQAEWKVNFVQLMSDIHKYHSYAMIGLTQLTMSMGTAYYMLSI